MQDLCAWKAALSWDTRETEPNILGLFPNGVLQDHEAVDYPTRPADHTHKQDAPPPRNLRNLPLRPHQTTCPPHQAAP